MLRIRAFALSIALSLPLLPLAGCWTDRQYHYYYPGALDAPVAQLFAWPTGEGDEFRFLAQDDEIGVGNSNAVGPVLSVTKDRAEIDELIAPASSLTVMLGPNAPPGARLQALALLDDAGRRHPGLSVHLVRVERDLQGVRSGMQLHWALAREATFRREERPAGGFQALFGCLGSLLTLQDLPNFIVVPLATTADRYAICGDYRAREQMPDILECDGAALAELLKSRQGEFVSAELVTGWGSFNGGERFEFGMPRAAGMVIAFCAPHDIPDDRRACFEELAQSLYNPEFAPVTVAIADAGWNWSDCTSAEFVQARVGTAPDWSFLVGPVRQYGLLPEPPRPRDAAELDSTSR